VNLGPAELGIVLVIILVLFGGAKLPKLARSLGQAQKEFKTGMDEGETSGDGAASTSTSSDENPKS
jgi:sec-independent protein translocase protein TatA